MVIDVFSKYGSIKPLKEAKGETVTKVFRTIFSLSLDLNGDEIKGSFNTEELLKVKQDVFRIYKVIRRD